MQTARDDVIYALRIYNDIPTMIAEEWATIRNCEEQREKVGTTAAKLREVTAASGGEHGEKTADLATKDRDSLFQHEIDDRLAHIDELRRTREWIRVGLACINEKDRYILSLAYIGPTDTAQRRTWRGKGWKEISTLVGLSPSCVRHRGCKALDKIKERPLEPQKDTLGRNFDAII